MIARPGGTAAADRSEAGSGAVDRTQSVSDRLSERLQQSANSRTPARAGGIEAVRVARALVEGQPVYGWVEGTAGSEVLDVLDGDPLQGPCQAVGEQFAWYGLRPLASCAR